MPAHRKHLQALIRDETFLARRHADKLSEGPLLTDPLLRPLQEAYRLEPSQEGRRTIALQFQHAVSDRARYQLDQILMNLPIPAGGPPPEDHAPAKREPGRPPKTLLAHVIENTFHPSRHAYLLASQDLPEQCPNGYSRERWQTLLEMQFAYQDADGSEATGLTITAACDHLAALFARQLRTLHRRD